MKIKQTYLLRASFAFLLLMFLGYLVKFYPDNLTGIDTNIQSAMRGDFPSVETCFFTTITNFGNELFLFIFCIFLFFLFYIKNWKAEAGFILVNFATVGLLSTALKYLYQRPRPKIKWLIQTTGPSFPSWHAASTLLIAAAIVVIIQQRMKSSVLKLLLQIILIVIAILVGISRIYIGVHHPTDVLGGWLLALGLSQMIYPYYDEWRFKWRFSGKQK